MVARVDSPLQKIPTVERQQDSHGSVSRAGNATQTASVFSMAHKQSFHPSQALHPTPVIYLHLSIYLLIERSIDRSFHHVVRMFVRSTGKVR